MVPGMKIVQSKPVVWATASHAFLNYKKIDHQRGPNSVAKTIKDLLHRAQENVLQETIAVGCNAVLGMSINVTTDSSSGEHGNSKIVIVTISGTPCSVMPMAKVPAVDVNNTVLPLYSPTNTELQH